MGNVPSIFLAKDVDWNEYINQSWRSDVSKQLDGLGGPGRVPIARGSSFSKKLELLESELSRHGAELAQFFNHEPSANRASVKASIPTFLASKQGCQAAAAWRLRVHTARRKMILLIKVIVKLMAGKLKAAPVPRLDRFDFAIHSALGGEWHRVAEEQQRYKMLCARVEESTVALQDAIYAAGEQMEKERAERERIAATMAAGAFSPLLEDLLVKVGAAAAFDGTQAGEHQGKGATPEEARGNGTEKAPEKVPTLRVLTHAGGAPFKHRIIVKSDSSVGDFAAGDEGSRALASPPRTGVRDHVITGSRNSGIGSTVALYVSQKNVTQSPRSPRSLCSPRRSPRSPHSSRMSSSVSPSRRDTGVIVEISRGLSSPRRRVLRPPTTLPSPRAKSDCGVASASNSKRSLVPLTHGPSRSLPGHKQVPMATAPHPSPLAPPHSLKPVREKRGSGLFICARIRRPVPAHDLPPVGEEATSSDFAAAIGAAAAAAAAMSRPLTQAGEVNVTSGGGRGGCGDWSHLQSLIPGLPHLLSRAATPALGGITDYGGGSSNGRSGNGHQHILAVHDVHATGTTVEGAATPGSPVATRNSPRAAWGPGTPGTPGGRSSGTNPDEGPMGHRTLRAGLNEDSQKIRGGAGGGAVGNTGSSGGSNGEDVPHVGTNKPHHASAPLPKITNTHGGERSSRRALPLVRHGGGHSSDGSETYHDGAATVTAAATSTPRAAVAAKSTKPIATSAPPSRSLTPLNVMRRRQISDDGVGGTAAVADNSPNATVTAVSPDASSTSGGGTDIGAEIHPTLKSPRDDLLHDRIRMSYDGHGGFSPIPNPGFSGTHPIAERQGFSCPACPVRPSSPLQSHRGSSNTGGLFAGERVLAASSIGPGRVQTLSSPHSPFSSPSRLPLRSATPQRPTRPGAPYASCSSSGGGGGGIVPSALPVGPLPLLRQPPLRPAPLQVPTSPVGGESENRFQTQTHLGAIRQALQAIRDATSFCTEHCSALSADAPLQTPQTPPSPYSAPGNNALDVSEPAKEHQSPLLPPPLRIPPYPPPPLLPHPLAPLPSPRAPLHPLSALPPYPLAPPPTPFAPPGMGTLAAPPPLLSEESIRKIEEMKVQCQARIHELQRCNQMISMLLNRCNAAWAESQSWGPPSTVTQTQLTMFSRSDIAGTYRDKIVRMLQKGSIAVHLRAADDYLEPGMSRSGGGSSNGGGFGSMSANTGGGDAAVTQENGGGGGGIGSSDGGGNSAITSDLIGAHLPGVLYRSTAPDLWTHDPWHFLEMHRPGMIVPSTFKLEGVPLGCRYIAGLVMALEGIAGQDAVRHLPLILVVNEDHQEAAVRELYRYRFFGIPRENVLVILQANHPGYSYVREKRTWEPDELHSSLPLGSGFGLMQLVWCGEAMSIGEDGCLVRLGKSTLTWMEEKGIMWMISRRARDLGLLGRDGVLDINTLAFTLHYHTERSRSTNIMMEAAFTNTLLLSRVLDSFILSRRLDTVTDGGGGGGGGGSRVLTTPVSPPLMNSSDARRFQKPGTGGGLQQQVTSVSVPNQIVELCSADLSTPAMRAVLEDYRKTGRVCAGLGRYIMHIPSIKPMLAGRLAVLRPKLGFVDNLLHVRMEFADVTSAPNAQTLLLQARPETSQLLVQDDVEALLPLLSAQDENHYFRHLVQSSRVEDVCALAPYGVGGAAITNSAAIAATPPTTTTAPRTSIFTNTRNSAILNTGVVPTSWMRSDPKAQRIVVFVVNNTVSTAAVAMAAALAQPARDFVMMVTIVSDGPMYRKNGEETLASHAAEFRKLCGAKYTCEILERNTMGVVDCMVEYATRSAATMVMVGSNSMTSKPTTISSETAASTTALMGIIGSITLALLRRLQCPLLIVTRMSAATATAAAAVSSPEKGGKRRALRLMAVLDHQSSGMVEYVSSRLCNNRTGDELFFSYIKPSNNLSQQQIGGIKAFVGKYAHQASLYGARPAKTLLLDGPADRTLAAAVVEHGVDLLTLPALTLSEQVSPITIATLRAVSTAVLLYRDLPKPPSVDEASEDKET